MKKLRYITLAVAAMGFASCSLDETNYSSVDTDIAYSTADGYQGIVDACYENIYYLYGKQDGIGPMEMGTDLWKIGSINGSEGDLTNYNTNLTPSTGVLRVCWNALYGIVGYANTAIYYHTQFSDSTAAVLAPKVAEARFLRAFAYFHIVEQWGGVVCDTISFAQTGVPAEYAYRKPETEFYRVIINDLNIAYRDLPVAADRGRATKKAAAAMLAKAYLQSTRLYDAGSQEYLAAADSAYKYATMLCDNSAAYGCALYESDANQSGNAKAWDGENNKGNTEYLFLESIDHVGGQNPEWWNRGRTSQYYQLTGTNLTEFGISGAGMRYGRANAGRWSPTKYLLTECFEPKMQKNDTIGGFKVLANLAVDNIGYTADTRFEDAFYYKYFALARTIISKAKLTQYKKDADSFKKLADRRIESAKISGADMEAQYPGLNYYAGSTLAGENFELDTDPACVGIYTPNWDLDTLKTAKYKALAVGPNCYYDSLGKGERPSSNLFNVFPSLRKHRMFKYVHSNQECMMDQPIIRLTDIYLLAAEASILLGKQSEGLKYLNTVRKHAARSTDAAEMVVGEDCMTIDYILKERARELCGEQWRWYDLKRTGRLTAEYLNQSLGNYGKNPYSQFQNGKHEVRPVPQQFLDQIANPDEFGSNGY